MPTSRHFVLIVFALLVSVAAKHVRASTFIDRWEPSDLRVVSYNVFWGSALGPSDGADPATPERFRRMMTALQPDVLALQEMFTGSAAAMGELLDEILPLPNGDRWSIHQHSDNVIASRYPFLSTSSSVGHADALIDLPDDRYQSDLYLINDHWPCCNDNRGRQNEANLLVNWIADRQGTNALPQGTPFLVVGDLNTVEVGGTSQPLETLLSGDATVPWYDVGPLDWDGTRLTDALPEHNGVGPQDYTWRDDSDIYNPGILDHVVFSDSVLDSANRFILNTKSMSESDLAATGLQADDVMINVADGFYDHLPLVVDFRERPVVAAGDYNRDGIVDEADYTTWAQQYNRVSAPSADGNGDGVVNAADYTVWRDVYEASLTATAVPEPCGFLLAAIVSIAGVLPRRRG